MTGPEGPGRSQEPTPLPKRKRQKSQRPKRSKTELKAEQKRHEQHRIRFRLPKRKGPMRGTDTTGITETPQQPPRLQIVDDKYHAQQALRERLGKQGKGALTRWLRDREKKKETPPDEPPQS